MNYICLICGFNKLREAPFDKYSCGSYEICHCCGCEFGYDIMHLDNEKLVKLRESWINNGMIFKTKEKIPLDWNANEQIKNLNKIDILNNDYEVK